MFENRPYELHCGECLDVLRGIESNSIDSLVTDPPAGISLLGKAWDSDKGGRDNWIAWLQEIAGECLRILKPGGSGLIWALPRTSHWTATALENAGFEIRDIVHHFFSDRAMQKGLNIEKAIDKMGIDNEWRGWHTGLKPGVEHWLLVRKPIEKGKTVVENVLEHGTGALNIGSCKVPFYKESEPTQSEPKASPKRAQS